MVQKNSSLGAYYREGTGAIDSHLLDVAPANVFKGAITWRFGGFKGFSEAGAGLTETQLSLVATGRRRLTYQQALKIAGMLNLPVGYLMTFFGKGAKADDE